MREISRRCYGTYLGSFESLPSFDCVATAANSFGLMDAGMDLAVLKFFGRELQDKIQKKIIEEFYGEQPVGTAFIVETGRVDHPYVAHVPTMRVPMNVSGTDHVYLAIWATLIAVGQHNRAATRRIETLVSRHSERARAEYRELKSAFK